MALTLTFEPSDRASAPLPARADDSHLLQLPQSSALDVRYSQLYVLVGHVFKIVLAVCFNLLLDVPEVHAPASLTARSPRPAVSFTAHSSPLPSYAQVLAPLLLSGTVLLLLWTLGYKWLLGETPCCQPLLTRIHAAGHAAAAWACLCCWLELRQTLEGGPALLGLRPSEAFCLLGWAGAISRHLPPSMVVPPSLAIDPSSASSDGSRRHPLCARVPRALRLRRGDDSPACNQLPFPACNRLPSPACNQLPFPACNRLPSPACNRLPSPACNRCPPRLPLAARD